MFYIYIGEVYHFKLGCVVEIDLKVWLGCSHHVKCTWICVMRPISMHNYRSTCQQRLQKEEITRNRSDNDSLSFRSITKIAAIHNPLTTQKITDRYNRSCAGLWTITRGGALCVCVGGGGVREGQLLYALTQSATVQVIYTNPPPPARLQRKKNHTCPKAMKILKIMKI